MAYKVESFNNIAVVLKSRRHGRFVLSYGEILTAERRRGSRSGIRLHVRTSEPLSVSCRQNRLAIENELRDHGVRVVDCWGCIITSSLEEFEVELMNTPVHVRQSYDDG